MIPEFHLALA